MRPPFELGNRVALRHGARSGKVVEPLARRLAGELLADRPDLETFPEALAAWARAEVRCQLLSQYHETEGFIDEHGNPRGGKWIASYERLAADLRARLGADPRSAAELQRTRAEAAATLVDLEAVRARGRRALEGRGGDAA